MPKKAFTLLELIIVIIIIGILATLGFKQYAKMVEKGRQAEARMILGQLRTAQFAYYQENGKYNAFAYPSDYRLPLDIPVAGCRPTHYFYYSCYIPLCTAYRCTSGGKTPDAKICSGSRAGPPGIPIAYTVFINVENGTLGEDYTYTQF